MTAVSLFDLLARRSAPSDGPQRRAHELLIFVETLIDCSLADIARMREYEQQVFSAQVAGSEIELEVRRSIWQLYSDWADEADQIFVRAKDHMKYGSRPKDIDQLDDQIGRVRARLKVSPEQIVNAIEQVRRGQTIPAQELRNELHARLRAGR